MMRTTIIIALYLGMFNLYGQNLIINPSAESDPFGIGGGWTSVSTGTACFTGSNWRITGNQNNYPAAQSGTMFFFSGCNYVNGEIYQDIDVSANTAQIDASSQIFTFSGYTRSFDQTPADGARIIVEFRDEFSAVLDSYDIGTTQNTSNWVLYTDTRTAVAGTRVIRIRLLSTANNGSAVDGYFDNLSLTTNIPLPVTLLNFTAISVNNESVKLNWSTASEVNNDYFTVERSNDGFDWEEITRIDGAGNSTSTFNYSSIDNEPYFGTSFYRLKQTDFDGKFVYSNIHSVKIENSLPSKVEIYPNPTSNKFNVIGSYSELDEIKMFNNQGQDITHYATIIRDNKQGSVIIDITQLNSGLYYLKTKTTTNKVYKQ